MTRRVAIMTGGGDAPGLNAVIRAFVKRAVGQLGWDVVGIEDSFNGLVHTPKRLVPLGMRSCQGLLHQGGTILGTTNHGDPFEFPMPDGTHQDISAELAAAIRSEGFEGLVVIGGDGTQAIGLRLMQTHGIPVVGVPKTIDNDLSATDYTFGFQSAVEVATEALDRLHTTAESHERIMFLEVMGRDAGHIALSAGISGGADVILIPEIPYNPDRIVDKIHRRQQLGRNASIIVVAEGALPRNEVNYPPKERKNRLKRGGGAAAIAMAQLDGRIEAEMRSCVLGHLQRGGSPIAFDRLLATRFGSAVVDLVDQNQWGKIVCLVNGSIQAVPISKTIDVQRKVDVNGELVQTARWVGIEFGDSPE